LALRDEEKGVAAQAPLVARLVAAMVQPVTQSSNANYAASMNLIFLAAYRLKRAFVRLRSCIRTATFVAQEATTTN
jgi:hypothetical protein